MYWKWAKADDSCAVAGEELGQPDRAQDRVVVGDQQPVRVRRQEPAAGEYVYCMETLGSLSSFRP